MHKRIFQVSKKKVSDFDYLKEDYFYDNFVGTVADFVYEVDDREESIDSFVDSLPKDHLTYNSEDKSIVFHKGFKEAYFSSRFKNFKRLSSDIDLGSFSRDSLELGELLKYVANELDDYMYADDGKEIALDHFVRTIDLETKYYFGSVIGYHY